MGDENNKKWKQRESYDALLERNILYHSVRSRWQRQCAARVEARTKQVCCNLPDQERKNTLISNYCSAGPGFSLCPFERCDWCRISHLQPNVTPPIKMIRFERFKGAHLLLEGVHFFTILPFLNFCKQITSRL